MEAIQVINVVDPERLHHGRANGIGRFVFARRRLRRQRCRGNELDRGVLQGRGEIPVDDSGSGHQSGKLIDLFFQRSSFVNQED